MADQAVTPVSYGRVVAEGKIWSADELLAMFPDERDRVIRTRVITDPALIPGSVIERARRKADVRIAATEGDHSNQ